MNHPQAHAPQTWAEYKYQDAITRRVQRWIVTGNFHSSILVVGPTGVGKTSLVNLMIKSTHCQNRKPGEVNPCNLCKSCKTPIDNPYNNVIWINPGSLQSDEKITYQSRIKDALLRAQEGPTSTGNPHRDKLFVVFEEVHLVPKDLLQQAMIQAEMVSPNKNDVVYVFLSMYPDKVLQALEDRGATLELKPISRENVAKFLMETYQISEITAMVIAKHAKGSLRRAIATYENCKEELDNIEDECSLHHMLSLAPITDRVFFWTALRSRQTTIKALRNLVDDILTYVSPQNFVGQLIEDLEQAEAGEPEHILAALKLLTQYLNLGDSSPSVLLAFLKQLSYVELVDVSKIN